MKKIINVIGLAVLVITMSFNVSVFVSDTDSDIGLASLITVAEANAECNLEGDYHFCESITTNTVTTKTKVINGEVCTQRRVYTSNECVGIGPWTCTENTSVTYGPWVC